MEMRFSIKSFTVENFLSIGKAQTVELDTTVKAFYGANASGKTNMYRALLNITMFILHSTDPDTHGVPHLPFLLSDGAKNRPSKFEIVVANDSKKYRYSFAVQDGAVVEESLFDLSSNRSREVFVRSKGPNDTATRNGFGKKLFEGNDSAREDSLLITLARRTNNEYADAIFEAVRETILLDLSNVKQFKREAILVLQRNDFVKKELSDMLKKADFNIEDFSFSAPMPNVPFLGNIQEGWKNESEDVSISTMHAIRDSNGKRVGAVMFDMEMQESLGTNRFFILATLIADALINGKTIYIDEFGSSLHTDLCRFIIEYFREKSRGGKLVINTHDTGLISNGPHIGTLGRDEINLVEKNRFGETMVTALSERTQRADENIGKKYQMGLYGGTPILDEITLGLKQRGGRERGR